MNFRAILSKDKFTLAQEKIREYFYSYTYPAITAAIVLVFWATNLQLLGLAFLVINGCYIFLTQRDLTPILPLLFAAPMVFTDLSIFSTPAPYIIFSPAAVAIVIHFIIFPIKKIFFSKTFIPLAAVSAVLFAGGLFSDHLNAYAYGLPYIMTAGVAMLAEYFVLSQYIEPRREFDLKKYFVVCVISVALLACTQLVFEQFFFMATGYLHTGDEFFEPIVHNNITWFNTIHIGYMILLAIPLCFYLMVNSENIIFPLILVIYFIACAVLTMSDGTIGILAICILPIVAYTYLKLKPKNRTLYSTFFLCLFCAVTIAAIVLFAAFESEFIHYVQKHFLSDTGRTRIYKMAIDAFLAHPILGTGLGYPHYLELGGYYHSTIFQVLGTMGIVGVIVYVWYFAVRIKIFTQRQTAFNFFAFVSFLLFELYSFIDNGEFTFLMIYLTAFVMITEIVNVKGRSFKPLPLKNNPSNKFN